MVSAKIMKEPMIIAITQASTEGLHSICNLRHKTPKEIPVVFDNGSNHDYHFIIKQLAEEFEGQWECLVDNTEKYITFLESIEKPENEKTIKYKIRFIDSVRFMASSLSSITGKLAEGLRKGKCKDCKSSLKYMAANVDY